MLLVKIQSIRTGAGSKSILARTAPLLLAGTLLSGLAQPVLAQTASAPSSPIPQGDIISSIVVNGTQRLEPDTVRSYIKLRVGDVYTQVKADQALKDLAATELFSDFTIRNNNGAVVIEVKENPIINRIILEGNKRLKEDKINPEIKLAPRQIFTRSKVRADVARIIELYKRQGRFAATVEPKMVMLDQNRVDIVFEISEGPKSKVRQINIIGNEIFSDGDLRGEMVTKQSRFYRFFSSGDAYDPDKLAFDQQKLRQFYLTEGYADFRVVSAVAELTPDKRDFIITYQVEEGERYKFGDIAVDSQIRDFDGAQMTAGLPMKAGDWYNAKMVEDTVEQLSETAGLFGYAFADVRPQFKRDKDSKTMSITFLIAEAPRVYVEQIDINGNTLTVDKVIRREFRLAEGDAFNSFQVKRSTNRIKSLGYFQENFEVEQRQGSAPDRIILEGNIEEKPTGELQLSAGFSSLESFILQASVRQRNFRGKGQTIGTSVNYSRYSKSAQISFTEPYLFDRNVSLGFDIFRRDLNSFNFLANNERNTTFQQATTGFQVRVGIPLTEYVTAVGRYGLNYDDVTLDEAQYFADLDGDGITTCEPLLAGRFLCDAIGKRTTSTLGYSLIYDTLDNRARPTRGHSVVLSQDFAGLGGSVKYLRNRLNASKYWNIGSGFIFSVNAEGGHIFPFENRGSAASGIDDIRLTDRFYLGEPQIRGFDIRGVGPRVLRKPVSIVNGVPVVSTDRTQWSDDAIGGRSYYLARAEIEIPLGSGAREMGLRPSIFVDAGAVFGVTKPLLQNLPNGAFIPQRDANGNQLYSQTISGTTTIVTSATAPDGTANTAIGSQIPGFVEEFVGDSPRPRVSVGFGVNWNSPFGPFRIDIAKALVKVDGDDTKLITFNVGTQF